MNNSQKEGNANLESIRLLTCSHLMQMDQMIEMPMEFHYYDHGLEEGWLPYSEEQMMAKYFLNYCLQIQFLESVGFKNSYADMEQVKEHI